MAMRTYVASNPELVGGILIASEHELYASNELYRITRYPLCEDQWYKLAAQADGERVILSKPIGRNIRHYRNYSAGDIVSILRAINDPETGAMLGVICVDMNLRVIEERIRDLKLGKTGFVFILDEAGGFVYAPVNEIVYRIRPEWLGGDTGACSIGGERYQLLDTRSDVTGFRTVGVFRTGEVLPPVETLRRYTVIFALIACFLATMTALSFSASFTEPISRLRRRMAQAAWDGPRPPAERVRFTWYALIPSRTCPTSARHPPAAWRERRYGTLPGLPSMRTAPLLPQRR